LRHLIKYSPYNWIFAISHNFFEKIEKISTNTQK